MTDKAVSTEDLCIDIPRNPSLDAARLEAVIKTLVENKAEALKSDKRKSSSISSSPRILFNKLRGASTSTVSSKDKDEHSSSLPSQTSGTSGRSSCPKCEETKGSTQSGSGQPATCTKPSSMASPKRLQRSRGHNSSPSERSLHFNEEDGTDSCAFLHRNACHCPQDQQSTSVVECADGCCCKADSSSEVRTHFDDDYVSLKMDECEDPEWEEAAARRALRKAQQKKRRRRKRRMKRHQQKMAIHEIALPISEAYKDLDPDELSQRARWTIVVTACVLLFMCLLLVGITLRMAPIIDDMVRKENEELLNSISITPASQKGLRNSTASVPFV